MQHKKEEVREKILDSAMKEFASAGYHKASVLNISIDSRVPIGNIYRYFKSKSDIFSAIIKEPYENMRPTLFELYAEADSIIDPVTHISNTIDNIFKKWDRELVILFDKSAGSEYEGFYLSLCDFVTNLLERSLYGEPSENDHLLCGIISHNLVDGLIAIKKLNSEDSLTLIRRLLSYHTVGIKERLF